MPINAIPPTTPPKIAPVSEVRFRLGVGDGDGVDVDVGGIGDGVGRYVEEIRGSAMGVPISKTAGREPEGAGPIPGTVVVAVVVVALFLALVLVAAGVLDAVMKSPAVFSG